MEMMIYTFFAFFGFVLPWNKSWVWGDVSGVEELETVKYFPATVLWWNDIPNNLVLTKDLMFFYVLYAEGILKGSFLCKHLHLSRNQL